MLAYDDSLGVGVLLVEVVGLGPPTKDRRRCSASAYPNSMPIPPRRRDLDIKRPGLTQDWGIYEAGNTWGCSFSLQMSYRRYNAPASYVETVYAYEEKRTGSASSPPPFGDASQIYSGHVVLKRLVRLRIEKRMCACDGPTRMCAVARACTFRLQLLNGSLTLPRRIVPPNPELWALTARL